MDLSIISVSFVACIFTAIAGLSGLFKPKSVAFFVGLKARDAMGILEIRSMFGGLMLGLSLVCMITLNPYAFLSFSMAWLGSAAAKYFSLVADKPPFIKALTSATFDAAIGACLLSGFFTYATA